MTDKANTLLSLQAIRAKLQQLQMQQPHTQREPEKSESKDDETEASLSNSFNSPSSSSTQHSPTDLLSSQNTASSLHLPERETDLSSQHNSLQLSGYGYPAIQSSLSQWQSSAEYLVNVTGVYNTKAPPKEKAPFQRVPVPSDKSFEASVHGSQDLRPHVPLLLGRSKHQNTGDFDFKVPKSASGTANVTSEEKSFTDQSLLTHPSSASKHSLQHFNSTPDIRSSASKPMSSQLKMNSFNLGKPMRVRMQHHPVHLLSNEREDDTDFVNSVKPLNPSHLAMGRFASLASSAYHSDNTITTENSIPDQPAVSDHTNLSLATGSGTAEHKALSKPVHKALSKPVDRQKQGPVSSHLPTASLSAAAPPAWGVVPVMSTPAGKGPKMQPAVLHTPSGEAMATVTVNGEQYCVLKKVGRGGSAQVYMVLDADKNIRALKVVDLEGAGPEMVDGFRNEIRLLQRLQYCPSVIKMFNFELNKSLNCLYVMLEFGETDLSGFFNARAKQGQGLDPTLIKFYWKEMLQAVNALHTEGVIHSDLKPANFMLVAGKLKLIDFGIANTLQQDKTSVFKESRAGTPSYMSPEAIMAACDDNSADDDDEDFMDAEKENHQPRPKYKVGVRSDVWSLGCILYNMVYGRTPFHGIKNNMAKLQAITNPAVPLNFPPLPIPEPHLMDVLQKCLQREVKSRPTTVELLAHPYLMNQGKEMEEEEECRTPPSKVAKIPTTADTASGSSASARNSSGTGSEASESRRLQELLKSYLATESPGATSAVSRVMDMLQKLESAKK